VKRNESDAMKRADALAGNWTVLGRVGFDSFGESDDNSVYVTPVEGTQALRLKAR
jgi:hypothetical protein